MKKITVEISESLFRKLRTRAAQRRQTLNQFVAEALREKIRQEPPLRKKKDPAWMAFFGAFGKTPAMRAETRRIQRLIDEEFENLT